MSKQVREMAAAKSISAYVILKDGRHVATVQSHYGDGRCMVDVWPEHGELQQSTASGYGYDLFTAALSHHTIDGVKLYDHSGIDDESKRMLAEFTADVQNKDDRFTPVQISNLWESKVKKLGMRFANHRKTEDGNGYIWGSLHYIGGLERLEAMGYTIISAI